MTGPGSNMPTDPRSGPPAGAVDPAPAPRRPGGSLRLAWVVAIAADVIQWAFPYVFGLGPFTPVDVGLDVVVMVVMTRLLGWHWAFVPTFAIEMLPFVDLVPTWTAAVWIATRRRTPPATRHTPS